MYEIEETKIEVTITLGQILKIEDPYDDKLCDVQIVFIEMKTHSSVLKSEGQQGDWLKIIDWFPTGENSISENVQ